MDIESSELSPAISRTNQACERCRSKRIRCSGESPCERCRKQGEECIFGYARGARKQSILTALDQHNRQQKHKTNLAETTSDETPPSFPSVTPASSGSLEKSPNQGHEGSNSGPSVGGSTDSASASPPEASRQPNPKPRTLLRRGSRKTRVSYACMECKRRRRKVCLRLPIQNIELT